MLLMRTWWLRWQQWESFGTAMKLLWFAILWHCSKHTLNRTVQYWSRVEILIFKMCCSSSCLLLQYIQKYKTEHFISLRRNGQDTTKVKQIYSKLKWNTLPGHHWFQHRLYNRFRVSLIKACCGTFHRNIDQIQCMILCSHSTVKMWFVKLISNSAPDNTVCLT